MRLDKWLKVSRLIKRRTVANEACDNARITVNGRPAKASYDVKVGDKTNTDIEAGNKFELSMKPFTVGDADYVMVVVTCKAVVKAAD